MKLWYFKDPVHGYIALPEELIKCIIDTPIFQRLRSIKQNQLGHYVYPHLEHTRFSHSLGVAHLVIKAVSNVRDSLKSITIPTLCKNNENNCICRSLEILYRLLSNEKIILHLATVGLIHDIAHGPYSHLYEQAIRELTDVFRKIIEDVKGKDFIEKLRYEHDSSEVLNKVVEYIRLWAYSINRCSFNDLDFNIISNFITIAYGNILDAETAQKLCESLKEKGIISEFECTDEATIHSFLIFLRLIKDLYDSNVDMDKVDYVIRDSIASGVKYGIFDYERLLSVLTITPFSQTKIATEPALGIMDKGISVVENLLLSRAYMYSELYLHRIKAVYDTMLSRFIALLLLAGSMSEDTLGENNQNISLTLLLPHKAQQDIISYMRFNDKLVENYIEELALAVASRLTNTDSYRFELSDLIVKIFENTDIKSPKHNMSIQLSKLYCISLHILAYAIHMRSHLPVYLVSNPDYERHVIERYRSKRRIITEYMLLCPLAMIYYDVKTIYSKEDRNIEKDLRVLIRADTAGIEEYVRNPPQLDRYGGLLAQDLINRKFYRFALILPIKFDIKGVRVKPIKSWIRLDLQEEVGAKVFESACKVCHVDTDMLETYINHISKVSYSIASELFGT